MSPDDALKIAYFVNKWKDKVDTIWVHCEVGVSRSAGIAMAIMEYLNMDLTPIFENPIYCPNMLCYALTKQAFEKRMKMYCFRCIFFDIILLDVGEVLCLEYLHSLYSPEVCAMPR